MKILHYLLGIPPVYNGGLVKYALDLAEGEKENGEEVLLLIPGRKSFDKKIRIYKIEKNVNSVSCELYGIQNALPWPGNGIREIGDLLKEGNTEVFSDFLKSKHVDLIHVHSLMGLYKEFLVAANQLRIPVVYTTHDYYGICLKTNLLSEGKLCTDQSGINCPTCCKDILDSNTLIDILYKKIIKINCVKNILNNNTLARFLTKLEKSFHKEKKASAYNVSDNYKKKINEIKAYYNEMFQLLDMFHFNSLQTREIFKNNLNIKNYKVIDITHGSIGDHRCKKNFGERLRITYLGTLQQIKGFYLLKSVLDNLYNTRKNFELNVFFATRQKNDEYIRYNLPYSYHDLKKIMNETDIVVVPSICKETFGFVVKEAISYGVPCIITKNVGAKDWVKQFEDVAFVTDATEDALLQAIITVYDNRKLLYVMNENVLKMNYDFSFCRHIKEVLESYKELKE